MKDLIKLLGWGLACDASHLFLKVIFYKCGIYIHDRFLYLSLYDLLRKDGFMLLSADSKIFDSTDLLFDSILHETSSILSRLNFSLFLGRIESSQSFGSWVRMLIDGINECIAWLVFDSILLNTCASGLMDSLLADLLGFLDHILSSIDFLQIFIVVSDVVGTVVETFILLVVLEDM